MSIHTPDQLVAEHRRYMQIFALLGLLTVLEIGATYLPISKVAIGFLLVGMAGTKAAMVALFYMHLALERRTLMMIAITPMVLCAFLVFMLMPDLTYERREQTRKQPVPVEAPAAHH